MILLKKLSARLDRISADINFIKGEISAINASMELMLGIKLQEAVPAPKKKGRGYEEYPQIGSLLHGSGITLRAWRSEAERNGWTDVDRVKYDSNVKRNEAMVIIRKAQLRKEVAES